MPTHGLETTLVDMTDLVAFEKALKPNTKVRIDSFTIFLMDIAGLIFTNAIGQKKALNVLCF